MNRPNPVATYLDAKTASKEERKANEVQLWQRWKDSKEDPKHLKPLLKLYEPIIAQHVRKHRVPAIPDSVLKSEVQDHTIKAFQTYDPNRGAALNTWVESRLPKVGRFRNRHQNLAYIPEGAAAQIGKLQKARDQLSEDLGRPPTDEEVAQHLGMKTKRVTDISKSIRRDVPMSRSGAEDSYDYSQGAEGVGRGFEDQQIAVAQNILPTLFPNKPEYHTLFHHVFGTNGHQQIRSTTELAKKMGKSQQQIARMKTIMGATLRKNMGLEEED